MRKKIEFRIVRRGKYYFVIIRQYRNLFWCRIWNGPWKQLQENFLSKTAAVELGHNVKAYLRGKYTPVSH